MEETIRRTVFDVASKSEVTLSKTINFEPAKDAQEALGRVGGNSEKFLALVNEGLRQHERETAGNDSAIPWKDETGKDFSGDPLDETSSQKLQQTVLTFAKTLFSAQYEKGGADRKVAKDQALGYALAIPGLLEKLRGENGATAA